MYGGENTRDGTLQNFWSWDETTWREMEQSDPGAAKDHSLVFDNVSGQTLFYGAYAQLWGWDGSVWNLLQSEGPEPRVSYRLSFHDVLGQVVMFDGHRLHGQSGSARGRTWAWNGQIWEQLITPNYPPAREGHAMCYDEARGVLLIQGGRHDTDEFSDTWAFDGNDWTQLTSGDPGEQYLHTMAFDSVRQVAVLVGHGATWEWNGASWQRIALGQPASREETAIAFDPVRNVIVLFGGAVGSSSVANDTWA